MVILGLTELAYTLSDSLEQFEVVDRSNYKYSLCVMSNGQKGDSWLLVVVINHQVFGGIIF